jgi:hypothetical protein
MSSKKITFSLIIILAISAIIVAYIYKNNSNKEKSFYASISEVQDGYILVTPLPGEDIENHTTRIIIYTEDKYNEQDTILIYYKGEITETNPSTINVTKIELIGTNISDINIDNANSQDDSNDIDNNISNDTNQNNSGSIEYSENDVINYFDSQLDSLALYEKTDTYKEKAKNLFITVVDFLFYDGEIKGYKFNDLSSTAKLKILNIAFKIDNKIEELFPSYKDTLAEKYQDSKNKIVSKYLEITANICSSNEEYCDTAKEVWSTIKEKAGLSWSVIKEYADKGINNLKDWYEVYSGE